MTQMAGFVWNTGRDDIIPKEGCLMRSLAEITKISPDFPVQQKSMTKELGETRMVVVSELLRSTALRACEAKQAQFAGGGWRSRCSYHQLINERAASCKKLA